MILGINCTLTYMYDGEYISQFSWSKKRTTSSMSPKLIFHSNTQKFQTSKKGRPHNKGQCVLYSELPVTCTCSCPPRHSAGYTGGLSPQIPTCTYRWPCLQESGGLSTFHFLTLSVHTPVKLTITWSTLSEEYTLKPITVESPRLAGSDGVIFPAYSEVGKVLFLAETIFAFSHINFMP